MPRNANIPAPRHDGKPSGTHLGWRIGGLAAFAILIGWAVDSRGSYSVFVDFPSLAIIVGCAAPLLLAAFGWTGTRDAVRSLLGATNTDGESAAAFFRTAAAFSLAGGFLGTLIGLVHILANMEDPSTIGAGMALALLTQLYGVLLAMIFCTAAMIIARRGGGTAAGQLSKRSVQVAAATSAVGVTVVLLCYGVVVVSLGNQCP